MSPSFSRKPGCGSARLLPRGPGGWEGWSMKSSSSTTLKKWYRLGGALLVCLNAARLASSSVWAQQIEPMAGTWKTWVLTTGSQFRLPPPPDDNASKAEIAALRVFEGQRDAAAAGLVSFWDSGDPAFRWIEMLFP